MQRTTRSVRSKVQLSVLVVYFVLSRQQRSGERNCPSHLIKVTVTVICVREKKRQQLRPAASINQKLSAMTFCLSMSRRGDHVPDQVFC